ncbi:phage tail assembly protein T [Paraburkholderia phenoliruptrix]|uniref:phage tail assembly protein T n=1 Tax=Paraburkholderia phenoliruptrix TaxID=252970 RepID=UPI001C4EC6AA|nr:hypothetical protein [Paraburkholderia phenoliruptrix]MBW0450842.1 hypothetical protein [Paraburkholderia phenoliruptrix]MBW9100935.1 hypothetical protein [Paraburkholderia phenoliruptrix]
MSVARCQQEINSAELTEWLAYYQIEPFGTHMDDLRAGVVTAAVYNGIRDAKKRPEPFGPADVIPWLGGFSPQREDELVLFDDPAAQTAMLRAALFGKSANGQGV